MPAANVGSNSTIPPTLKEMRRQRLLRLRRERVERRLAAERRHRPYDWQRDGIR